MTPASTYRRSRARLGATLAAIGLFALTAASCTRSVPIETIETTLPPMVSDDGPLVGAGATTAPPPPTTEPPLGGSPARLAPLNVAEHDMTIEVGKDRSLSHPVALVPIEVDRSVADTGSCYALLWTIDALATDDLLLNRDTIPVPSAVAGDVVIEGDKSPDCDRRGIRDAGWGNRGQIRILPEASFNVASAFFVPKGTAELDYLVLSGPDEQNVYYEATVSSALPELPAIRLGTAPTNVQPPDPNGEKPFEYGDTFQKIQVTVRGVVPDVARVDGAPGSCVSIIGTIKPTKTVGAIMNTLAVPDVGLLVDGTAIEPTATRCGTVTLTSNRWYPIQQAGVSVGNTFAFAQSYAVSSDNALVQGIVIGDLFRRKNRRVYAIHPFDSTPEAPAREKVNPKLVLRPVKSDLWTDGVIPPTTAPPTTVPPTSVSPTGPGATKPPATAAPTTAPPTPAPTDATGSTVVATTPPPPVRSDGLVSITTDAIWTAAVYGLFALPSDAEAATCYGLLTSWRVTGGEPTDPPPVGLIAGGAYWGAADTEATCDTKALVDAGWVDGNETTYANAKDAPMKTFMTIFIPADAGDLAGIGIGNVADDVNVAYFAPTIINAIPGGGATPPPSPTTTP